MDDALGTSLAALRVEGSLLLAEAYAPPWAVDIPAAAELAAAMGAAAAARVIAFHLVCHGHFELHREGQGAQRVQADEAIFVVGGDAHRMSRGACTAVPFSELLAAPPSPPALGTPGTTRLICGAFVLHHHQLNPLLGALPDVLHIATQGSAGTMVVEEITGLLTHEVEQPRPGSAYAISRLLEIFFAEAIRTCLVTEAAEVGWFRGVSDPALSRAMGAVHARPEDPWTVRNLAKVAGLSPSRFSARFRESVGESPMKYVTRWRMNVAMRLLSGSTAGIGEVASQVGYENLAAFGRAFKKHVGETPGRWRAAAQSPPRHSAG